MPSHFFFVFEKESQQQIKEEWKEKTQIHNDL